MVIMPYLLTIMVDYLTFETCQTIVIVVWPVATPYLKREGLVATGRTSITSLGRADYFYYYF